MDIRKDLATAAVYLNRLSLYGDVFSSNDKNWSHLKNQEDFREIFSLDDDARVKFEMIYQDGRNLAIFMLHHLKAFNYPDEFPTLTSYVNSFEKGWLSQISDLEEASCRAKEKMQEVPHCPWAVEQMITLFDDQIELLQHIEATVNLLRKTEIFIIENGGDPVAKANTVYNISNVSGRVNVNSTDNSINVVNCTVGELFTALNDVIKSSEIGQKDRDVLLSLSADLEASAGSPTFAVKYKEFIQQAANYMTIISPFIPGLTNLITG